MLELLKTGLHHENQGKRSCVCADVSAAVAHALGLLVAHAIYSLNMRATHRGGSLRSGPLATGTRNPLVWALLQASISFCAFQSVATALLALQECRSPLCK